MKALCLYLHMVLFVIQISQNGIWKFGRNLLLAKFGSERVNELYLAVSMNIPWLDPIKRLKKNRGRVHYKELVQNISTYFQRKSKWKGLRNFIWQYRWIFPNWPSPNFKKSRGKVHRKELVQNISTYFQRQKLEWTANTTTVQAPPLLLVDQRLRLSLYCWDRSVLSLVPYLN